MTPKRGKSDRVKMSISLPKYIVDKLEEYANRKALPKGIVIQLALEEFFKSHEEE